jgi:8-oxo-dGTP diphosphatase
MPFIGLSERAVTGSKNEMKTILVAAGIIIEQGKILATRRKPNASHGLLWEFPGGKVEEEEDPRKALQRELKEELDIDVEVGRIIEAAFYLYPEYPILLLAYHCRIKSGIPKLIGCHELRWVDIEGLKGLEMPPADDPIRDRLSAEGFNLFTDH